MLLSASVSFTTIMKEAQHMQAVWASLRSTAGLTMWVPFLQKVAGEVHNSLGQGIGGGLARSLVVAELYATPQ